jgi:hypothetical protein
MKLFSSAALIATVLLLTDGSRAQGNNMIDDSMKNNATTVGNGAQLNTTLLADTLCSSNIQTCNLACDSTKPIANSCNTDSLEWDCQCPPGANQTIIDQAFPVAFHHCQKDYTSCISDCLTQSSGGSGLNDCTAGCVKNFACGTASASSPKSKKSSNSTEPPAETTNGAGRLASSVGALLVTFGLLTFA